LVAPHGESGNEFIERQSGRVAGLVGRGRSFIVVIAAKGSIEEGGGAGRAREVFY